MSTMDLGEAQMVTIVYATPDGPRVTDIALADRELAPGDPRQPGGAVLAAHPDARGTAVDAVAVPAGRQRQRRLIPGNHTGRLPGLPGSHHVVWNWQAAAVHGEPK